MQRLDLEEETSFLLDLALASFVVRDGSEICMELLVRRSRS
jgi:hypothetical protein